LGRLASFHALEAPHARLHELVREFASLLHRGERRQALALTQDVERELNATLTAIDVLIRDVETSLGG
jgi:hypothetical protein